MEHVLSQLREIMVHADDAGRKAAVFQVQELLWSLETSDDTVNRIAYAALHPVAARIGIDLKIFNTLAEGNAPQTLSQLEKVTGADPELLRRLLRYMSAVGQIKEASTDEFAPNQITKNLALPGSQGAIGHVFYTCGPTFQALPSFLSRTGYRDPVDGDATVFQPAHQTDLSAYAWLAQHPQNFEYLNQYMAGRRLEPEETWLAVRPVEAETRGWAPDAPVFVNIGGGIGHQCAEFKSYLPHAPGTVVLQDLPEVVASALPTPGVVNMAHDFFTPQPVKGARYYYFRGVLHNWPDDKAQKILENIVPAMTDQSMILIDELVLPPSGVHASVASIDLMMMTGLASRERTKKQWAQLLDPLGLEIRDHNYYKEAACEGVMVVGLKSSPPTA